MENLFEKIIKDNFLSCVKEIDTPVKESQRVMSESTQIGPHQDMS